MWVQVDVLVSLTERKNVAMSGGGGFKQGEGFGGIFGMVSFAHRNLFGQGQKLQGSAELGQVSQTAPLPITASLRHCLLEAGCQALSFSEPVVWGQLSCLSRRSLLYSRAGLSSPHTWQCHSLFEECS